TGLRLGELMGLEWSDIDFDNGIISITKASQYLAEKGVFLKDPMYLFVYCCHTITNYNFNCCG
ncbi:MAG: hypothetical protein Q4G09_04785, partial [Clostridia bacterium]|nr:hypothetical protein [Clostridia bacterium]